MMDHDEDDEARLEKRTQIVRHALRLHCRFNDNPIFAADGWA